MPTDRRVVTALAAVHLAGWLLALAGAVITIGADRLPRVISLLARGEQWLLFALATALVVLPLVSALALVHWRRRRGPWPVLAAAALSVPAAAAAVGRWPHLVPWWAWVAVILVEGCGLVAAYLALLQRRGG